MGRSFTTSTRLVLHIVFIGLVKTESESLKQMRLTQGDEMLVVAVIDVDPYLILAFPHLKERRIGVFWFDYAALH